MQSVFKSSAIWIVSAALVLSACSNGNGSNNQGSDPSKKVAFHQTGLPIVDETVTLKMVAPKSALAPEFSEMDIFKRLEKKTHVKSIGRISRILIIQKRKIC